ncbi:MAG: hypothetical protein Q8P18_06590 [Pseudomonadota bacterium]|nr:hypothetical protein [Pseudomonadota bacterium]
MILLLGCAPMPTPRARFDAEVVPVLERGCTASTCHGTTDVPPAGLTFTTDGDGTLVDLDAAYATAKSRIDTAEDPAFSTLLRKTLATTWGGLPHAAGAQFPSPEDPAYLAIAAWIAVETGGGEDPAPLSPAEQRYADTVQPELAARGCFAGGCHGIEGAVPFRLDPGVGGAFPVAATRANYDAARAMLSLDGDASQSRLLRKALPLWAGGILHKGGNTGLLDGPDDPAVAAIEAWACAEREERLGEGCAPRMDGFVYVRGPVVPADAFDLDVYLPGSDLWWWRDGASEDLTSALHATPADVRDPAIDPTGTHLLFAMRTDADAGHALYEMDLATRIARRLTEPGAATDRAPTYGPDGHVWFSSTRGGSLDDAGLRPDAELYELDPDSGTITRRTWTPHVEIRPVFLVHGNENGGEVAFTALREADPRQRRAHPFRFPPDLATEYHQHFGITPTETLVDDLRELPDGRYVALFGALDQGWEGGSLAIIDRNFGPEITDGRAASIPNYLDPVTRLADGRRWRDPAPLPDGTLLAAVSDGGRFRIVSLGFAESVRGDGPAIVSEEGLAEDPELSVYDPEPVVVREPAPMAAASSWNPESTTGLLHHQGLPVIDALLSSLSPAGARPVRDDIVGVRLIEGLPRTDAFTGIPARTPTRVLGELPLAADGTFQAELPAGVPFRIQGLDAAGRAVGAQHNRWFYVAPGQTLSQGVQAADPDVYGAACAACHGALDGDPDHAFGAPDVLTTASVTLSRYQDGDPARPLEPPRLGDATRIEVDWHRDVRPLLDGCAGCHDATLPPRLDDTPTERYDQGYEALLDGWVEPGSARGSRLVEVLTGEALDAPGEPPDALGAGAHGGLDADALRTIARWIDLGASWVGTP